VHRVTPILMVPSLVVVSTEETIHVYSWMLIIKTVMRLEVWICYILSVVVIYSKALIKRLCA